MIVREVWYQLCVDGCPVAAYRSQELCEKHISIFYLGRKTAIKPVDWIYCPNGSEWTAEGQAAGVVVAE